MLIPKMLLRQMYNRNSLVNTEKGISFSLKNRLKDVVLTEIVSIEIDGKTFPAQQIQVEEDGKLYELSEITTENPLQFPLGHVIILFLNDKPYAEGKYQIEITVKTKQFGKLNFTVEDAISAENPHLVRIPRDIKDDYVPEIIKSRQEFIEQSIGHKVEHISQYSFDPQSLKGNIEHFVGVAQIPIGLAGPLHIRGEHAQGDFLIPLATTEGTLVASYNRGMKVLNLSGGVICSVVDDVMQRAPVFVFNNAREAREFAAWVQDNFSKIAREAESTSSIAHLRDIDTYLSNKFAFLRFNYTTGDAAGQNMVGRATFAACSWIVEHYSQIVKFYLESNFATDKKASQINIMRTRGKRVVAECTIPRDILIQNMRVEPEQLAYHAQVSNIGAILSGANNNGLHSANGITAMFIATGQDVANVSESSAGVIYTELTENRDLYISITIPSLIVATHGGGTGLATQRECLEILGCTGRGKVKKFAEIVAGVVLAGEISLASAISSSDWVSSHEQYGRNR
ncbi:MAG: hydroxymethylglutaryl-CoA reductase [Bacteroidetes bacterium]|nr:hydroxymethylglutaryl-CoA reductase [Bacteroidota bacterium]